MDESLKKASPPSTKITFFVVHFDTEKMTMSIPEEKIQELRADLDQWIRKTTDLQYYLKVVLGESRCQT